MNYFLFFQYILSLAVLSLVVLGLGLLKKYLLRLSSRLSAAYLRRQANASFPQPESLVLPGQ